jgi:predicted phosphodiesterase
VELIINGDFLDFVQAPPCQEADLQSVSESKIPLCFTEEQSLAKLEAITSAHDPVFKALYELVTAKVENKLVILPGNHDADFYWPKVRALFIDRVCGQDANVREQVNFHLEQVYRPVSYSKVWVEHGHQYDPLNSFYVDDKPYWSVQNPPILKDHQGQLRLLECIGTRFMIKFMNRLDADYPFVDNVKPFSRFLTIFGASAFVWGFGPIKAAVSVWAMLRYLVATVTHNPSDLLGLDQNNIHGSPLLLEMVEEMTLDERKDFTDKLRERGFELNQPLIMYLKSAVNADKLMIFLSENLDLLEGVQKEDKSLLGASSGTLKLAKGFSVDETRELILAAKQTLQGNILDTVIMGHTHEPVSNPPGIKYLNTGSWTRYYRFADDEKLRPWSLLKTRSYETFPYQLNYAEIVPGRLEPTRLITYRERKA